MLSIPPTFIKYIASEFICTMLLVNLTCLACSTLENSLVPLSLVYGMLRMVLSYCFRPISGAHANPAVSLALYMRGCMRLKRFVVYVISQIAGAIAGHFVAYKVLGLAPTNTLCAFSPKSDLNDTNLMAAEFFLTFVIIITWCALWDYEAELPMEFYLGAAHVLISLLGGYVTGASTNPARAIAPWVFSQKDDRTKFLVAGQVAAAIAGPMVWGILI